MTRQKFKLSHSLLGTGALLAGEAFVLFLLNYADIGAYFVLAAAALGAAVNLYVATEVIEEVKNAQHMLVLLFAVLCEFVIFFAFQYQYLLWVDPNSFPTLGADTVSLLLHSVMIFVFNPLYLPASLFGRVLLLINTLGALGLVLFILQNIWQFRRFQV